MGDVSAGGKGLGGAIIITSPVGIDCPVIIGCSWRELDNVIIY
jgi:hypothetical protein